MKRLLAALAVTAAGLTGASAADISAPIYTKAPPVVAPLYNWTGFYIGGSVGGLSSKTRWTTTDFQGNGAPSGINNPANLDQTTFRGGFYAGYNWQVAPSWVLGVEADYAWQAGNNKTSSPFPGDPFNPAGATGHDFVNAKLSWDAGVRGRVGYLFAPNWLLFATGGGVWQRITASASCDGNIGAGSYCGVPVATSVSTTRSGWTVGGGIETMVGANWLIRGEYRYAQFDGGFTVTLPPAPNAGFNAQVNLRSTHTALFGVAYKF